MEKMYTGCEESDVGKAQSARGLYDNEKTQRKPFKCVLDVGIIRTTTGNRVFGALKGACDGGLDVPHSEKRFPGQNRKSNEFDAEVHRKRIQGVHVDDYLAHLKESGMPDSSQFNKMNECLKKNKVKSVEELVKKTISAIKKDSMSVTKKGAKTFKTVRKGNMVTCEKKSWRRDIRLTCEQRGVRVREKIQRAIENKKAKE